ncbi:Hypothetical predicted protein, partial [Podarcis lilfordi]
MHPQLQLQVTEVLNLVTPPPMGENGPPTPDCIYSSRPDLKDEANPRQYQIGLLRLIYTNPFDSPYRRRLTLLLTASARRPPDDCPA